MIGVMARGLASGLPTALVCILALGLNLPWPLETEARAALPFLVLPVIHGIAFYKPAFLPAPLVLAAGLIADLIAETPLGYAALLYLGVLASGRGMRLATGGSALGELLALPVCATVAFTIATLVPLAFTLAWPPTPPILAGIGLGLMLEALLLLGSLTIPLGRRALVGGGV